MTSASAIAEVMADIHTGRLRSPGPPWDDVRRASAGLDPPIIDATEIYRSIMARNKPIMMYEDHECIAPPWEHFAISYVNEHGNVILMLALTDPTMKDWETAEPIDWSAVRWKLATMIFIGGYSTTLGQVATTGPMYAWQYAIGQDGEPLDLHWVNLVPKYPADGWATAQLVFLGALNFLNCRNVEIVEPSRPRAERRRIERTGMRVSTINAFPAGRSGSRLNANPEHGVPLTSVRGHFARYGPGYGRKLLFGKYAGRFWIPQFARGSKEHGEVEHDYVLRPEANICSTSAPAAETGIL